MQSRCADRKRVWVLFYLIAALFFCRPALWADTQVSGAISTDTVWDVAGSPYIVNGNITIQGTDGTDSVTTLTIQPGVEVRFPANYRIFVGAASGDPGALVAMGTSDSMIVFTSGRATPAPGNWNGIYFADTADDGSCVLDYCIVEYASTYAVQVASASPTLQNSIIRHGSGYAVYLQNSGSAITGNSFTDNGGYGIYATVNSAVNIVNNAFSGGGNYDIQISSATGGNLTGNILRNGLNFSSGNLDDLSGNTIEYNNSYPVRLQADWVGRFLAGNTLTGLGADSALTVNGGTVARDATWTAALKYAVQSAITVQGTDGADSLTTLTLEPGAQLRFGVSTSLTIGGYSGAPGALAASGSAGQEIVFTSAQATPQPGNWSGINILTTADNTGTVLDHCIVEYASTGFYINSASTTIQNSVMRNCSQNGIYASSGTFVFSGNAILNNGSYGIRLYSDSAVISDSTFENNGNFDIYWSYPAGGTLSGNTLHNGLYCSGGSLAQISGNTFYYNDTYPVRLPADSVGELLADNTLLNVGGGSVVEVNGGVLARDAAWTPAISYRVVATFVIQGADGPDEVTTLTLAPGARVRFNPQQSLEIGGGNGTLPGALDAQGTSADPIVFTSAQAAPAAGDWRGIRFYNTTDDGLSVLDHCLVEYAGYNNSGAIYCYYAQPPLRNTTIARNAVYGMQMAYGAPDIENCQFQENGNYDVYYSNGPVGGTISGCTLNNGVRQPADGRVVLSGNTVHYNNSFPLEMRADSIGAAVTGNTIDNLDAASLIKVVADTVSHDATWTAIMPYTVSGAITVVGTDGADSLTTLILEPGVELRMGLYTRIDVGANTGDPGALIAQGSDSQNIVITSGQPTPAAGDWYGVRFYNTADDATSKMEYCTVEYGGYSSAANIFIDNAGPAIQYNLIRNSSYAGVRAYNSGATGAVINCNNIKDNRYGIYTNGGAQPAIEGNNFLTNLEYGLYHADTAPITAANNWWGDASGPGAGGDAVYGNVNVEPWRTTPSDCVSSVSLNDPPLAAQSPQPADGATGLAFPDSAIALAWVGGDPNPSDTVTYDVLLGPAADSLTAVATGLASAEHTVSGMQPDTTYYWQVVTTDNNGAVTPGPVWSFTTGPPQPDLVVSDLTWTPDGPFEAGQLITFTATVENIGPGDVTPSQRVDFSFNGQSYTYAWINQVLATGESMQFTRTWTAQVGPATVTVTADARQTCAENDETNNTRVSDLGEVADTTPPQLSSISPADGASLQLVNNITFNISDSYGGSVDTAATAASLTVTVDGGQAVDGTVTQSGNWYYFTPSAAPFADGAYQVSVTALDLAGNSQTYTFAFAVDNQKPPVPVITGGTVTSGVLQPRPTQNRSNKSGITLTGTREDNTRIYIRWASYGRWVAAGSSDWSIVLSLVQGDNALEINSYDAAGNISDSVWVDIQADSIAPVISAVSPPADSFFSTAPAIIVTYTETGSGLDSAACTRDILDGTLSLVPGTWTDDGGQLQFSPAGSLADDTYTLEFRLVDNLGNASDTRQSVFTLDTAPPPPPQVDPVTSPTQAMTQNIRGRKEAYAAVRMNGTQIIDHTSGTTWQHTVTLSSGENSFAFIAVDRAGNQSAANQISIIYDDIAPPAVTTLTADGQGDGTSVLLNWTGYNEVGCGDIQTYRIYQQTGVFTTIDGLSPTAELNAGIFTHRVQNLTKGVPYWFAVVAVDASGNFTPSFTAVEATPSDTLSPGEVLSLAVQSQADRLVFTWQPPQENQADLAGYRVYFNGTATAEPLAADQTSYERTGLASASAYSFKITTYDSDDNESSGASATGYTWLDNPAGLTAEPFSGYVQLSWTPSTPTANVKHYAVYAQADSGFTSVSGMTPAVTTTGAGARVAGLTNGRTYYFAVTAVNRSDGERPDVTAVAAIPAEDESGPQLGDIRIDQQPLVDGQTVTRPATITCSASDPSGISRIEFLLDGGPLHIDYNAAYQCPLDILQIADGTHSLDIVAYDTLDNSTGSTFSLVVQLALPAAPVITQPAADTSTNQAVLQLAGTSETGSQVEIYLEGQPVGGPAAVDEQGRFAAQATLAEGVNRIRAAARNRSGLGAMSSELLVTLDTTQPQAPRSVTAQALEEGAVRLAWSAPLGKLVVGYDLYRSDAAFDDPAAAVKINSELVSGTGYRDLPPEDGLWYYRLVSVDSAQNQSPLSQMVTATADSILPRASAIVYTPHGNVDPVSGAVAPGQVDVALTVSEPLMAVPFLSMTPEGGQPVTVRLSQVDQYHYSGFFMVEEATPCGTAYAVFSARDRVGNRGTEIDSGPSLLLDTDGPAVRRIVLDPATPIQNDSQAPVTVSLTIGLNETVAQGTTPALEGLLSGPGRTPLAILDLAETSAAAGDAQTWQGSLALPADAGQLEVETLRLAFQAEDSLGNVSTRILAPNLFQVYQGDLPPLAAPAGLTAVALPGGQIDLDWEVVDQAVAYQLYRQAPDETELTFLARIDGQTGFLDATHMDGIYTYAVTSLRSENSQEAESGQSAPVTVTADAQAPAAPQNLTLLLIPPGIEANWSFSGGEEVTFRLYRAEATQITSIDGLSPLDALFNGNKALDNRPSPSAHCYVVTAVDETGNESAPSESAYLNFQLLPVATLEVEKVDDENPQLAWTHPGGDIAGYDVYMGPAGQPVKVNTAPITDLSMTDSGYAGDTRGYSVIAVDANGAESPARTLNLPLLRIERDQNSLLRRGIMNKLDYTVTNLSDQFFGDLQLYARVGEVDHAGDRFSLGPKQSRNVAVIVGGYAGLLDAEPLRTTVAHNPEPGASARLIQSGEILVGEGMLTLQLYSDTFVRGGTGKIWFTLENTGQAEIEIVTARKFGNQPSNEMRYTLVDADGNVLSSLDFQQGLGAQIVNLFNGTSVARIPAGAIFESQPMDLPVPANAPDELTVRLAIDAVYHHLGQEDQITLRGFGTTASVLITETEYTGEITAITPQVTAGIEDVTISGRAVLRDSGQSLPNAPLNLVITLNGFERKVELETEADGAFSHTFTPLPGETGTYKVAALHPDLLERPVQATFTVTKVGCAPARIRLNMPKNYSETIPIEVAPDVDTQVHNLRLEYQEWDQPANAFVQGLAYDLGQTIAQLGAGEKAVINLTVSSDNSVADSGTLVLRLVSDETGVQPWAFITIDATFTSAEPYLVHSPNFVETGVLLGELVTETIALENKGLADLEGVTLSLIGDQGLPVPAWAVLNAQADAGTLAVGDKQDVSLTFAPPGDTSEGLYLFYLRVEAGNHRTIDIPIYVSVTPSGIGNALFKVKDIFTGTLNAYNEVIQGLSGARITLQNEKNLTLVYNQTSDDYGEALFANLSAGIYKYRLQAQGYQEKIGRLWVKPGLTTSEDVFLEYSFVTVEWEVVETTIQDKYEIVLNITYETDVPAPVVVCEPSYVALPDLKAGDVLNGEFTLTNHGLIRADNLEVHLPASDAYIQYELLAEVPDSLGAKQRITIPYRLTCLQSLSNAEEEDQTGGGSGCYGSCGYSSYSGVSSNGCPYAGTVPHCYGRPCGGGGSSSGGGVGWWYTGGYGYGGYYGHTGSGYGGVPTSLGGSGACTPAPGKDDTSGCGGGGGGGGSGGGCDGKDSKQPVCQDTGSSVNLFMRAYTDNLVDLSVKVPGGSIDISRSFYNDGYKYYRDAWHFLHNRTLEFDIRVTGTSYSTGGSSSSGGGGGSAGMSSAESPLAPSITTADGASITLVPIKREGVTFKPDENKTTLDPDAGEAVIFRPDDDTGERIVYLGDDLWRWEDKYGNWETYAYAVEDLKGVHLPTATTIVSIYQVKQGRLTAYGDRRGTIAKLLYAETGGNVAGITDRNDRQVLWFEYTQADDGRTLVTIRDVSGRQIEYEITESSGRGLFSCYAVPQYLIHRYKDASGQETVYEYGSINSFKYSKAPLSGHTAGKVSAGSGGGGGGGSGGSKSCDPPPRLGLTKITDAAGRGHTIAYDEEGAVASVLDDDGNGYHSSFSYDEKTREYYAQVRDTNGRVKEVWIDIDGEATRLDVNGRTVKTFAKDGNTYTITDENGNQTIKEYDQWDNLVRVVHPDGARVSYTYDLNLHRVKRKVDENNIAITYAYDEAGRLTERVEAVGTDRQRTTEFEYDTDGNLAAIRRPGDTDTAEAVTTLTYDADGNLETLTDPEDNTTAFTYDVMGNVLTKTDPRGKTWTYTYDGNGRLKTVTDPLDHQTEYFYDEVGNKIREVDPEGKVSEYEYDLRDNLKKAVNPALEETLIENTFDGRIKTQTDGEGKKTRYEYDADGRLARNIDGNGNLTDLAYSGDGSGCATCGGGDASQPARIEFPTFTREIKYDGRGRKYAERDLYDNQELLTRYTYDGAGNLTTKTDAEERTTTYEYDELNRLVLVTDPDNHQTRYAYDKRDNLVALTDAEDQTTRFEYDRNNRLVKEIRPMGEETAYAYDGAGNLTEKTDAKNQRSEYLYDDAGRLETIHYYSASDPANPAKSVTFTYDNAGNLIGYDDGTTSAVYGYDDTYRKVTETVTYPGFTLTNTYTYYKNGLKKSYTGPDDITYGYLYDSNSQLTGIQILDVGMFTVNDHTWMRPSEETLPGGAKRQYQYDPLMRVANITSLDPGGNAQLTSRFTYDKVDNITARATEHGDYSYTYDDLYRLTGADNPDGQADESFTYDAVGNRITSAETTGAWAYNINNELEGYDNTTFQYDANGNLTEKSVGGTITRFFYNLEDRLERVEDGSGGTIATYYYDPFGRRLWKEVGGARTYFHYSDEGLVGEYNGAGDEIKTYGWKTGSTWSTDPLFMKQAGQYFWYHNDYLGTPQMMTTSSGAVVWKARYSSFGKATVDNSSTIDNPLRLPGQYEDTETGLHYNYYRYYDNNIGKYLRTDPIRISQVIIFKQFIQVDILSITDEPISEDEVDYFLSTQFLFHLLIENPQFIHNFGYISDNPINLIDPCGLDWLNNLSDISAGFGDTISFGFTRWVRQKLGSDDVVNKCSGFYTAGKVSGYAWQTVVSSRLLSFGVKAIRPLTGSMKQWIRIKNSYSKSGGFKTFGMQWGASPAKGGKYLKTIGSQTLRRINQALRNMKLPGKNWRVRDPGHFHFWRR